MFEEFVPWYGALNAVLVLSFLVSLFVLSIHLLGRSFPGFFAFAPVWMRSDTFFVVFFLSIMFVHGLALAAVYSPTYDEHIHMRFGSAHLLGEYAQLPVDDHPMMRMVFAVPMLMRGSSVGYDFSAQLPQSYVHDLLFGRFVALGLLLLCAWLVFVLVRSVMGAQAARVALALCVFFPMMVGHGILVTTDALGMVAFFMAFFFVMRYYHESSRANLLFMSLFLSVALLAKFTSLLLVPVVLIVLFVSSAGHQARWKRFFSHASLMALCVVIVINGVYAFEGSSQSYASTSFVGPLSQVKDSVFASFPLVLPQQYVRSFDYALWHSIGGHYSTYSYMRGVVSENKVWYAFIYAALIKIPIPMQLLFLKGFFLTVFKAKGDARTLLLLSSSVVIGGFVVFSVFSEVFIGFRYLLFVLPFIVIVASALMLAEGRGILWAVWALLVLLMLSCLFAYPYYLNYYNEFVGVRNGYRHLVDSDTSWGQNANFGRWYVEKSGKNFIVNPITCMPVHGDVMLNVNLYAGIWKRAQGCFDWIHAYEPRDVVAGSWLIFDTRD